MFTKIKNSLLRLLKVYGSCVLLSILMTGMLTPLTLLGSLIPTMLIGLLFLTIPSKPNTKISVKM